MYKKILELSERVAFWGMADDGPNWKDQEYHPFKIAIINIVYTLGLLFKRLCLILYLLFMFAISAIIIWAAYHFIVRPVLINIAKYALGNL